MKTQLYVGTAFAALAFSSAAFAQSSGTVAAEEDTIVVTGSRTNQGIQGVSTPDTPKARTVLSNEVLSTAPAGQTVLQAINIVPSVNFTNNDPSGASGGNVRIRGFDGNRVSLTFDGLPLNDTGNYAIFSNQQLDPEVIEQVNVNQGTTDVDSPTAASSGGTINYRSLTPSKEFGAILRGSYGESYAGRPIYRVFGMVQTGDLFGTGIRAFASASSLTASKYRGAGKLNRDQYNVRFYKSLGDNGDFIALAGHYNRNRNASYRSLSLLQANQDIVTNGRYLFDNNPTCVRPTFVGGSAQSEAATPQTSTVLPSNSFATYGTSPLAAVASPATPADTSCTNYYGVRINPSNTGNVRFNSKFTLTDNLVFTLDAGYQYVLANGGGFSTLSETDPRVRGYQPGVTAGGKDLSGDGDTQDTVAFYTPNTTNTNRYTVLSSLRWDFMEGQSVRVAYAYDYGRHRQTGEWGLLGGNGDPQYVFGGRAGYTQPSDVNGYGFRQRDRFSIALLNQVSAEYRGKFFDNKVEVLLGVRAPFFHRELNQYCYTQLTTGNPICTGVTLGNTPLAIPAGGNALNFLYVVPSTTGTLGQPANAVYAPFKSTYNYKKVLPNIGLTFRPTDRVQIYASYAKGLSAPRTDNLYRGVNVNVAPETTDNFDAGIRYSSRDISATFGGFYNKFENRIVTSFDADTGISVDRNVGRVEIKGLEASVDVRPFSWFTFRGFASYIDAQYKDNVAVSSTITLPLIGKKLVETPEWQYGYRAAVNYGPVTVGANFKHVTARFATDLNDVVVPGYSTFDLDARVSLKGVMPGLDKTFVQLNINNLFDEQYLGSISSQSSLPNNTLGLVPGVPLSQSLNGGTPTFQPGSPRSISVAVQFGF